MKITEHEMRGLLAGKCLPGDMRVNEELPAYLVRKFDELQQKLDAMAKETPATDTDLNSVRAEGIHFAVNRILAAWECGFINDTPAQAHDISGAVLSALEFLPNASPEEFKRDYADEVRASIAERLRSGTHDTTDKVG